MSSITNNATSTGAISYPTPTSTVTPYTGAAAVVNAYQGLLTGIFILLASHIALAWM